METNLNRNEVESQSIEFGSIDLINDYLSSNKIKNIIKTDHRFNTQFNAGRLLRENQDIVNALDDLKLYQWDLTTKASSYNRHIIVRDNRITENIFNHFNISINFKLTENLPQTQLGIGVSNSQRINKDGLKLRLKDIVNNNRNNRNVEFRERYPVILDSGDGGILFHEIIGHSLEADYIAKKMSPFSINDIGKQIFPENLTISTRDNNDSFFSGIKTDDEGNIPDRSDLVTNGVLNKILSDNYHNYLLEQNNSCSARTEDFTKLSQPRMYSIYIKPGKYNREELIDSVEYGVFAKEFGEGKVFFSNKTFSLIVNESYLIENGKITDPLGTIILKGKITEVLNSIEMIGNDFRYDKGVSYCYKNGQTLSVRVGQPSIKIDNVSVSRI